MISISISLSSFCLSKKNYLASCGNKITLLFLQTDPQNLKLGNLDSRLKLPINRDDVHMQLQTLY